MRQVGSDELAWKIVTALRNVPRSTWKEATDPRHAVSSRAKATIATTAARALDGLEVLSSDPAAPDQTFSRPMARMLWEDVGSGAPVIDG